MFNKNITSIIQLIKVFKDEQTCIEHLEALRWDGNVVSPFDETSKVYKTKRGYKCKNTGKYFNVKTNTLFDNTKVELQKWFMAIWLVTSHKKGISSIQLSKDIDVTQKTAWFMLHRIRNCFGINDNNKLDNIVEADETYIGGDVKNMTAKKRKVHGGVTGINHKKPILGMLERDGNVKCKVLNKSYGKEIKPILYSNIETTATVVTDGFGGYKDINKVFNQHEKVNHSHKEYVRGVYHTNTIEGFWSQLKRSIIGIYHHVSKKHLQKYADTAAFRYNTRKLSEFDRMNVILANSTFRLKYNSLING